MNAPSPKINRECQTLIFLCKFKCIYPVLRTTDKLHEPNKARKQQNNEQKENKSKNVVIVRILAVKGTQQRNSRWH